MPASGTGGGNPLHRDVRKHIVHVFADLPVGHFLTLSEIRNRPSPEYADTKPSADDIQARLTSATGPAAIPGIVPDTRDGRPGASKTYVAAENRAAAQSARRRG